MKKLSIILSICVLFSACQKDDDETTAAITDNDSPVIATFTTENTTVAAGNEIHMDMQFTDNIALKQAKLEIHSANDGHSHGRVAAQFEWEMILDLQGQKSYTDHMHVEVPANAEAGEYHLTCLVTDESGNESDLTDIDIKVTTTSPRPTPTIRW